MGLLARWGNLCLSAGGAICRNEGDEPYGMADDEPGQQELERP